MNFSIRYINYIFVILRFTHNPFQIDNIHITLPPAALISFSFSLQQKSSRQNTYVAFYHIETHTHTFQTLTIHFHHIRHISRPSHYYHTLYVHKALLRSLASITITIKTKVDKCVKYINFGIH